MRHIGLVDVDVDALVLGRAAAGLPGPAPGRDRVWTLVVDAGEPSRQREVATNGLLGQDRTRPAQLHADGRGG